MNIQPTYQGYIEDEQDALLILQAVLDGYLLHVPRRLYDIERPYLIVSGNILIFIEELSGIKRWTDGISWSPSRISTKFLVYREYQKKKGSSSGGDSSNVGGGVGSSSSTSVSSSTSASSSSNSKKKEALPPLTSSEIQFQSNSGLNTRNGNNLIYTGFVKKSISVKFNGQTFHIVSYYNVDDINYKKFIPLKNDIFFKYIKPSPALTKAINDINLTYSNSNNSKLSLSSKNKLKSHKQKKSEASDLPKFDHPQLNSSSSFSSSASASNSPSPSNGLKRDKKSKRNNSDYSSSSTNNSNTNINNSNNIRKNNYSISSQGTVSGVSTASASTDSSSASASSVPFLTSPGYQSLNMLNPCTKTKSKSKSKVKSGFDSISNTLSNYGQNPTKTNLNPISLKVNNTAPTGVVPNSKNGQWNGLTGKFYNLATTANSANSSSNTVNYSRIDQDPYGDKNINYNKIPVPTQYLNGNIVKNNNLVTGFVASNNFSNANGISATGTNATNNKWSSPILQSSAYRNPVPNEGNTIFMSDYIQQQKIQQQMMQNPQSQQTQAMNNDQFFNQFNYNYNYNAINNNFLPSPTGITNAQGSNQPYQFPNKNLTNDNMGNISYNPNMDPTITLALPTNYIGTQPFYSPYGPQFQGNYLQSNNIPQPHQVLSTQMQQQTQIPNSRHHPISNNLYGAVPGVPPQVTGDNLNNDNVNYDSKKKSSSSVTGFNSINSQQQSNLSYSTITSETISTLQNQMYKNSNSGISLDKSMNYNIDVSNKNHDNNLSTQITEKETDSNSVDSNNSVSSSNITTTNGSTEEGSTEEGSTEEASTASNSEDSQNDNIMNKPIDFKDSSSTE